MPDELNGQVPVEETTTPMPSENKPEEDSLPDEVSDRTKEQFDKLKEKNREMAQRLEAFERPQSNEPKLSALERLRPQVQPVTPEVPTQVEEQEESLADENGYLDEARLKKGLDDSKRRAQEAEQRAAKAEQTANESMRRIEEYEVGNEKKRVHSSFPEIDPYSDKFTPELYDQVSKDMLWNLVNSGKEDFYGTTEKVVSQYRSRSGNAEQNQEQQDQTNRAKQEVQDPGRSGSITPSRKEELMVDIQRPKQAGMDALTELMRHY